VGRLDTGQKGEFQVKIVFETDRIQYAEVTEQLLDDYIRMVNDIERVGRLIGRTGMVTREKERRWVREKLEQKAPLFSMIEKNSGEFIGNIELMDVHSAVGELGIAITVEKQERGFGTEAIPAVIDYGVREFGLGRIFLKVYPDNARAIHVYEKCGFREYDRTPEHVYMEFIPEGQRP